MNLDEIERKLTELDRNLHSILKLLKEIKRPEKDVVDSVSGAWGYDVDSVEFIRGLRKSRRT